MGRIETKSSYFRLGPLIVVNPIVIDKNAPVTLIKPTGGKKNIPPAKLNLFLSTSF